MYQLAIGLHAELLKRKKTSSAITIIGGMEIYQNTFDAGLKQLDITIGEFWFEERAKLPLDLSSFKKRLVLYDPPTEIPHDQAMAASNVAFKAMKGLTRSQMKDLMLKATVVLDEDLPGWEFGNLEASVMGAVFLGPNHQVARNPNDYPYSQSLRYFDGPDVNQRIAKIIEKTFKDYKGAYAGMEKFVELPYRLRLNQRRSIKSFFEDDVLFYLPAVTLDAYDRAVPLAVTLLLLYPHSSVEVVTGVRQSYRDIDWVGIVSFLAERGFGEHCFTISGISRADASTYGNDVVFVRPPTLRRRHTMIVSDGRLLLGDDLVSSLAEVMAELTSSGVSWVNYKVKSKELSPVHFVLTERYYRFMPADFRGHLPRPDKGKSNLFGIFFFSHSQL